MGKAIVAVSITPVGTAEPGVSRFVAEAEAVLASAADVRHEIGPMFTCIEGELTQVFDVIVRMQEAVFAAGARRVSTVIKVDERRDRPSSMEHKVAAVRRRLAER
jgi:uncharacterized protein (TIGR00106 family)